MKKLLVANWKMNPQTKAEAVRLLKASDAVNWVVCPPAPFISEAKKALTKAKVGAQNVSVKKEGPFTGEYSADQIKAVGAEYVILGHSERRALGETDEEIAQKLMHVLEAGLTPILCVGETGQQRQLGQTREVLDHQLRVALVQVRGREFKKSIIVAYEPVWAISTSHKTEGLTTETPADANELALYIKSQTTDLTKPVKVLYGGSVNSSDILSFLQEPQIDGTLIGGASLKVMEVKLITKLVTKA
jgi:triosephosphate isomerase